MLCYLSGCTFKACSECARQVFCKMEQKAVSVVFINDASSRSVNHYKVNGNRKTSMLSSISPLFSVPLKELPQRLLVSLVPPVTKRYRYVYSDLSGPVVILVLLAALLHYGHASKLPSAAATITPATALAMYVVLVPLLSCALARAGSAQITMQELTSLLGYGLMGHVLTLGTSLLFYHEMSNTFFFCCLTVFGGLCALRVALVLLAVIPVPAARLIVCSVVATLQLLSIVFLHFAYMHRTFVYGVTKGNKH